jgi:hypothetical protein
MFVAILCCATFCGNQVIWKVVSFSEEKRRKHRIEEMGRKKN